MSPKVKNNITIYEPSVSVVVTTYNSHEFLRLSILSIFNQSVLPGGGIVIADDGSGSETHRTIEELRKISPVPIVHVWQPDEGFRAGRIRNIAIASAIGEYLILIDGDIVMHRHFIRDHITHRRPKTFVVGSRVCLSPRKTREMIGNPDLRIGFLSGGIDNRIKTIRSGLFAELLKNINLKPRRATWAMRSCNMSCWKKDLIEINGFDDDFRGWGYEDNELLVRFLNVGGRRQYVKLSCMGYHLYHKESDRGSLSQNKERLIDSYNRGKKWCDNGIDKFLADPAAHII